MADSLITLFKPKTTAEQDEELRRENQARTLARMSPQEMSTYLGATGGEMLGRGAVQAGAAALGYDARTPGETEDDAVAAAKRQVQQLGFDPEKPESVDQFYRQVISILQKQGLVAQAMQVAKEYQAAKAANTRASAEVDKAAAQKKRSEQMGPRVVQMISAYEAVQRELAGTPEDDPKYAALEQRAEMLRSAIEKEGVQKGIKIVPRGNKMEIVDDKTGETIREVDVGAKPKAPGSGSGGGGGSGGKGTQVDRDRAKYIELARKRDSGEGMSEAEERELDILEKKLKMTEDKGRGTPAQEAAKIGTAIANMRSFVDLARRFRKEYSGDWKDRIAVVAGMEDAAALISRMYGSSPAAAAWWQKYFSLIARIRNALFGASLTDGESRAFQQIKASLGDKPAMLLQIIRQQAEEAYNEARGKAEGLKAAGFNADGLIAAIDALGPIIDTIPATVSGGPSPSDVGRASPKVPGQPVTVQQNMARPAEKSDYSVTNPVQKGPPPKSMEGAKLPLVNSKAEFDALPAGAEFIDGRTGKPAKKAGAK